MPTSKTFCNKNHNFLDYCHKNHVVNHKNAVFFGIKFVLLAENLFTTGLFQKVFFVLLISFYCIKKIKSEIWNIEECKVWPRESSVQCFWEFEGKIKVCICIDKWRILLLKEICYFLQQFFLKKILILSALSRYWHQDW